MSNHISIETGLRADYDVDYGFFALPRMSVLGQLNSNWSARIGGGLGYKLPTIFTEEAENLTFQGIQGINSDLIDAERSLGMNLDVNFKTSIGKDWTFSLNQLFFYTKLNDALVFRSVSNEYLFENANGPVESRGIETNAKLGYKDFKLFANYAFIDTKLRYDNLNKQKPLTPKHNIGAVLVYEKEGKWRIGYEAYYTGSQFRSNRSKTSDYWIMGVMIMRKINKVSLYMNFENFNDTRQHKLENFDVNSHFKPDFPELYAPTDGRIINAGIIIDL